MACFLACFGFSKKPKRRKIGSKVLSEDHGSSSSEFKKRNRARYEPLDSEDIKITRKSIKPDTESEPIDKSKEQSSSRVKKKVSFNLNVRAYEPLPKRTESDEEIEEEIALHSEGDRLRNGLFPSNHRYQNWRDGYDEEEEEDIELEDSDDLDDEDIDDLNDLDEEYGFLGNGDDNQNLKKAEVEGENSGQLSSLPRLARQKTVIERNCDVLDRSQYVSSVLNPVENLTQWKEMKAREASELKHRRKENTPLPQEQLVPLSLKQCWDMNSQISAPTSRACKPKMQETAVNSSLLDWVSPQQIAATPSWPLEQRKVLWGKSNLYTTICELDEKLMYRYRGTIHRSG